jgi:hypothetical protein
MMNFLSLLAPFFLLILADFTLLNPDPGSYAIECGSNANPDDIYQAATEKP